jgi:alpha-beta hydrolase superfamily lysophospholipase
MPDERPELAFVCEIIENTTFDGLSPSGRIRPGGQMIERGLVFNASDGKKIAYSKVMPNSKPAAVMVIGHGMNDYGGRFELFAQEISKAGAAVYIPDLRGHGDTDPGADRGYLADRDGFNRVVKDLVELGDFASGEQEGAPLFYFGHSFGALVGLVLAANHGRKFKGVMLSAPPAKPDPVLDFFGGLVVNAGILLKGAHAPARLPRNMTFGQYAKTVPNARTDMDWLTRDEKVVDAYLADPGCNFVCSYSFYKDLISGVRKVYSEGFLKGIPADLPLYLLSGSKDPVIGMKQGAQAMEKMLRGQGLADLEVKCYEEGRHESLNETNRAEVYSDLVDWFSRHIA